METIITITQANMEIEKWTKIRKKLESELIINIGQVWKDNKGILSFIYSILNSTNGKEKVLFFSINDLVHDFRCNSCELEKFKKNNCYLLIYDSFNYFTLSDHLKHYLRANLSKGTNK